MSSFVDEEVWDETPDPNVEYVEFKFPPRKNMQRRGGGCSNWSNESSNCSNNSGEKDFKRNEIRGRGNGRRGQRGNFNNNGNYHNIHQAKEEPISNLKNDESSNKEQTTNKWDKQATNHISSCVNDEEDWDETPDPNVEYVEFKFPPRKNMRKRGGGCSNWTNDSSNYGNNSGEKDYKRKEIRGRGNGRRGQRGNFNNNGNWRNTQQAKEEPNANMKNDESIDNEQATVDWDNLAANHQKYLLKTFGHLAPVVRKTYHECKRVVQFTPQQVAAIRKQKNSISVTNIDGTQATNVPNPITQFHEAFENYKEIMNIINNSGFTEPSPIQCQLWPIIMSGYDTIGIAQTGTGKTLAYLLPCLIHINAQDYFRDPERRGPLCIILAPTRELAQQIHEECNKFRYRGIRSVCIYGQGDYRTQKEALEDAVEIVVATPGRLYDFIKKDTMDVHGVSYLVLDEADRMLDMGFLPDISKITCDLRPDKQVVLTSATWACDVEYVVTKLMQHDKLKVVVGDLDLAAVDTVTQHITVCEEKDKFETLVGVLKDLEPHDKVLVFCNRKAVVDYLVSILHENMISCDIMHGGLEQSDRENSLKCLKNGDIQVLLATDVASRGLDILDLTMVINLDLPKNLEEYVHRCGRTGRAGKEGKVISFVTWENRPQAQKLIDILQRTQQEIPRELQRLADKYKEQQQNRPPNSQRGGRRGRGGYGGGRGGNGRGRGGYGGAYGSDIDAFF